MKTALLILALLSASAKPVRVAGDKSAAEMKKRQAEGIPMDNGTLKLLARYAGKVGADVPDELQPEDV